MNDIEAQDDDYVEPDLPLLDEEVEDGGEYAPATTTELPPREFAVWHRPRKQLVRRAQWCKFFDAVVRSILNQSPHRKKLIYFGLPGSDMIDVRLFAEICANYGLQLRYLGFDRAAGKSDLDGLWLRLRQQELKGSDAIDRSSVIMPDDLRELSDRRSLAYTAASELSFDVVNLDLCGSATNYAAGQPRTLYQAIDNLFHIQSMREEPWLLLLTSTFDRGGQSANGRAAAEKVVEALKKGLEECDAAAAEAASLFPNEGAGALPELDACSEADYSKILALALVRWLSVIGRRSRPTRLNFLHAMAYRLKGERPDPEMFSLAIKVTPLPPGPDTAGLLPPAPPFDECEELAQQVGRIGKLKDADRILSQNEELYQRMRTETADMLEQLQYEREAYLSHQFSLRIEETVPST